jgi:hypothetical protein
MDDWVHGNFRHLWPACFRSVSAALEEFTDLSGANWLETANDGIPTLPISSLVDLWKAFTKLRAGNPLGSLRSLLDAGSSLELSKEFAWRPLITDSRTFIDEYDAIVSRARGQDLWGVHTLRGKFEYTIPEELPNYGKLYLTAHSKVVLNFGDFTLLGILLASKATGVFPSLANVWGCVPFSFVLDWFTNLGDRLALVDTVGLLMMLQHYYSVHTIKIESDWSKEYLDYLNLEVDNGVTSSYPLTRTFNRRLSFIMPGLRPSRFDFESPTGKPGLSIVGSLAWQVLT